MSSSSVYKDLMKGSLVRKLHDRLRRRLSAPRSSALTGLRPSAMPPVSMPLTGYPMMSWPDSLPRHSIQRDK